ncbi:transmembrane and coiled-coil domains protein 1-like [Pitangus sulphuratus]|nr:transmembrane and coiled-coil domains protein 1-like [Pitangus sulphuratus]
MEPSGTEQLCDDPDPGGKSQDQETKKQHESEQKLSKITHNALENINVIGQGLKHLFQHQRRRSSVSPHDVQQAQGELEPDLDLESQSVCAEIDGVSTHPTALNRVLQQIRVPPKMKRGTSLHSRWGKADAPKGSPQINRRSAQDIQSGRPRSSSTTDAPTNLSVMEIASSIYVGGEEAAAAAVTHLVGVTPLQIPPLKRDLVTLDQWTKANGMRFKKAKCQALPLGHYNPTQWSRFWTERLESSSVAKALGALVTPDEHELGMPRWLVMSLWEGGGVQVPQVVNIWNPSLGDYFIAQLQG